MKIIVSFSGGKDSQACLIQAANKYGANKIEAVFCDTGWEHPDTYTHIHDVCESMGVKLVTLKPELDFVSVCKKNKRFPEPIRRFCTVELKIKPMIDYILSLHESCIIIEGIRALESHKRASMQAECMYFKLYYTPNEKGKYATYRKRDVLQWCTTYDASVIRPIFTWTAQRVIDCILDAGQNPNPLYSRGFSRVGCFPCVMSNLQNIKMLLNDKAMCDRLLNIEKEVISLRSNASFFKSGFIPKYACANGKYPTVEDVFKYVRDKNATLDMFESEGGYACMSLYHGLCE